MISVRVDRTIDGSFKSLEICSLTILINFLLIISNDLWLLLILIFHEFSPSFLVCIHYEVCQLRHLRLWILLLIILLLILFLIILIFSLIFVLPLRVLRLLLFRSLFELRQLLGRLRLTLLFFLLVLILLHFNSLVYYYN